MTVSNEGIELCKKWIDSGFIRPRKTINKRCSSYSFKHFVEYWAGEYISNEEFVQAMIDKGYKARKSKDGETYYFNWAYEKGHDWYTVHKSIQ